MTDIIALPEMTEELQLRLWDAYDNASAVALECPDLFDVMEAVVEAYLSEAVRWQPIEPSDIKPGMRVRRTWCFGKTAESVAGIVKRVDINGWIHLPDLALDLDINATWEVDPRTIPTNPDQPILDLLALWHQQGLKGANDLLIELRSIADVTPKEATEDA